MTDLLISRCYKVVETFRPRSLTAEKASSASFQVVKSKVSGGESASRPKVIMCRLLTVISCTGSDGEVTTKKAMDAKNGCKEERASSSPIGEADFLMPPRGDCLKGVLNNKFLAGSKTTRKEGNNPMKLHFKFLTFFLSGGDGPWVHPSSHPSRCKIRQIEQNANFINRNCF